MPRKTLPPRRGFSFNSLLWAFIGLTLVVVIVAFGLPYLLQNANGANSSNTGTNLSGQGTPSGPPVNKGSSGGYSHAFLDTVQQHIAQGLHLTADQVTAQVSGGKQITDVAAAQGVSPDQLHTIELDAYQAAFDQAVQQGVYTQSEAVGYMNNYRQRDPGRLNDEVTFLFGGSPVGTPTGPGQSVG